MAETIPGFELISWQGLVAPKGTPRDVINTLNREVNAVLMEPDTRKRLADTGVEPVGGSVEMFEQVLKRDYEKYGKTLRDAGVKPE
jgi:tripartite-type tricarboxylate transporter receptor subunit TctC